MDVPLTMRYHTAARRVDENEPREPPPPATPLQFPSCSPTELPKVIVEHSDIGKLLGSIGRPGVSYKCIKAFNISISNDIQLDDLLSADFLPPTSWLNEPVLPEGSDFTTTPPHTQHLSNGREAPGTSEFHNLVKELSHENGDAFRAARRQPGLQGRPTPQIIHSRKFWNGLADMAEHWDTSLDRYIETTNAKDKEAMDINELRSEAQDADKKSPGEDKKTKYTGRRTDTGSKMPGKTREETVFGFVEMSVWAFSCTLENPTMQPKLQINNLLVNLPFLKSAYRIPRDARKARAGVKEGPLMGVFCREQTKFRDDKEPIGEGRAEVFDLLKETGLLTMLAQKRAREGKEEADPGAGKWWASTPRWGGGPGGEFGSSEEAPVERETMPGGTAPPRKRTKKTTTQAELWRAMKPPPSLWEKGVAYKYVGKDAGSQYDDVSNLMSSLTARSK